MKQKDLADTLARWQARFGPDIIKNAKQKQTEYGSSQSLEEALKIEALVKKGLK